MVKFGARVQTWDSLPMSNFVIIAWELALRGRFIAKIPYFDDFSQHFYSHVGETKIWRAGADLGLPPHI